MPESSVLSDRLRAQLRAEVIGKYRTSPLSARVLSAFDENPRHLFVRRYFHPLRQSWVPVDPRAGEEVLAPLYSDEPVLLYRGSGGGWSTLSQPSFVLHILDLLDLQSGHVVFELGTASGWNAALMSHLVGPTGQVVTMEIVPELALMAEERLVRLGLSRVNVLLGDGARGFAAAAPYDRVIFTAAAHDIPRALNDQLKDGGRMVFVLSGGLGPDILYVLEKKQGVLRSCCAIRCGFVPVVGEAGATADLQKKALAAEEAARDRGLSLEHLTLEIRPIVPQSTGMAEGTQGVAGTVIAGSSVALESPRRDHLFRFLLPPDKVSKESLRVANRPLCSR